MGRFYISFRMKTKCCQELQEIPGSTKEEKKWYFDVKYIKEVYSILKTYHRDYARTLKENPIFQKHFKSSLKAPSSSEKGPRIVSKKKDVQKSIIPKPEGLEDDYAPFQVEGVLACKDRNSLIADEMGLGKTLEAIGIINVKQYKRILISCTASTILNWKKECEKWLVDKSIPIYLIKPNNTENKYAREGVYLTTHTMLHKLVNENHKMYGFDCIIFDESHFFKNRVAQRTRAALFLCLGSEAHIICMTGSPVMNKPIELWPQLHMLRPDIWPSEAEFCLKYLDAYQTSRGYEFRPKSDGELKKDLYKYVMIRRLKKDVMKELPPKRRQIIEIEAVGKYASILKKEKNLAGAKFLLEQEELVDDDAFNKKYAKNKNLIQLRQQISKERHATALAKLPEVINIAKEFLEQKDKLVIFAHHRDLIAKLEEAFKEDCIVIQGGVSPKEREERRTRFQTDKTCYVAICSIHAAAEGITLTAADTLMFAELDWVPFKLLQAEDRIHRHGQTKSVNIYHVVLAESIDCLMARILVKKLEMSQQIL